MATKLAAPAMTKTSAPAMTKASAPAKTKTATPVKTKASTPAKTKASTPTMTTSNTNTSPISEQTSTAFVKPHNHKRRRQSHHQACDSCKYKRHSLYEDDDDVEEKSNWEDTAVNQIGCNCDCHDESYQPPSKPTPSAHQPLPKRRRLIKGESRRATSKNTTDNHQVSEFKGILAINFQHDSTEYLIVWQDGSSTWQTEESFTDPHVPKLFGLKVEHMLAAHELSRVYDHMLCNDKCPKCIAYAQQNYQVPYSFENPHIFLQSFTMSDTIKNDLLGSEE